MPMIGLGTYLMDRQDIPTALSSALELGYRRIDCAPVYFNEDVIGDVLQNQQERGDVNRDELFVVSKLPSPFHRKEHVELALRKTLNDLRLDYLDLYLVHWPIAFRYVDIDPTQRGWENEDIDDSDGGNNVDPTVSLLETWLGMQEMVEKGLTKYIGLSNVPIMLLHELLASPQVTISPFVNQVELHPYLPQDNLVQYCQTRDIAVQAYSPLGTTRYKERDEPNLLTDEPVLQEIASKHGKSVAQVLLKWAVQRNTSINVQSSSATHQRENFEAVADDSWKLNDEDLEKIRKGVNTRHRFFRPEDWWGPMGAVFE